MGGVGQRMTKLGSATPTTGSLYATVRLSGQSAVSMLSSRDALRMRPDGPTGAVYLSG